MYLLHFTPALKHAGHYLGVARQGNLNRRLRLQLAGKGASLPRAALAAGCRVEVARTWIGVDGRREAAQKRQGGFKRLCPICSPVLQLRPKEKGP